MKINLIFHGRFPSEKADSLFAILDAKSFVDQGVQVDIIVPRRLGRRSDVFGFYGLNDFCKIKYLPILDLYILPIPKFISYFVGIGSFAISCLIYSIFNSKKDEYFYSNEIVPLYPVSFIRKTFYEMHDYPESKKGIFARMITRMDKILIHNRWKTDRVITEFGINKNKIITLPNAVSVEEFDIQISRQQARQMLGLPLDKKIVVYTGHFYSWKGVDLLAQTASKMPQYDFYFIGGNPHAVEQYRAKFNHINMHFLGFKPHREIPIWQKSADCLVLPNTAKEDISKYYTSPMKLFEYMASGVPIVASQIPSIEEIVSDFEVKFFEPDSEESLTNAIDNILQNKDSANNLAKNARVKVNDYTWRIRAKKIINFINE